MGMPYPCPHCRADFSSPDMLNKHVASAHHADHPERKFRCTTCDEAFMEGMAWLKDYRPAEETGAAAESGAEPAA